MNYSPPNRTIPTTTKVRREAAFGRRIDWAAVAAKGKEPATDLVIPGVDLARLRRQYGPDRFGHPNPVSGDFPVPIEYGKWGPNYERVRDTFIKRFIEAMAQQGFSLYADESQFRPKVSEGTYPYYDVRDQCWDLSQQQFIFTAYFRSLKPKPIDFEIDPRWVEPTIVHRGTAARKG